MVGLNTQSATRASDWLHELERSVVRSAVAERLFGEASVAPILGPYQLVRRIGRGTAGVLFEGRHAQSRQSVRLEILDRWSEGAVERLTEAFARLREVQHPNLPRTHELCLDGEAPCAVTAWVEGNSLAGFVQLDTRGSTERIVQALTQLVDVLSTLHAAQLLHCGLQPANVRVDPQGQVLVLGFGLAHALRDRRHERRAPRVGSMRYTAPERWQSDACSTPSDWFSVGVLVAELLPWVVSARRGAGAAETRQLAALARLCHRLLSLDPLERPQALELRRFCGLPSE